MNESRIDTIEIQSRALEKTMAMTVYVPANGNGGMPVLYLMHGRSGDENMMDVLDIQSVADKMIASGAIQPMVIVCPRMDDALGLDAYESYFFGEIMPLIEKRYHTGVRHIGGFSAGGYIALRYSLLHPGMFAHVGGHMPAIDGQLDDEDLHYFGTHEKWAANNPLFLARQCGQPPAMAFYLDAGDEDEGGFHRGCAQLAEILKSKGIHVQNHLNKGHHTVQYVKEHLEKYLAFYSDDSA